MSSLVYELRLAFRALRKSPGHTVVTTLILACGLGLTLWMFASINAYVLKPLPYAEPDQLVSLRLKHQDGSRQPIPYLDLLDWREQQTSFTTLAAIETGTVNLSGRDRPLRFEGGYVTADTFDLLGVKPAMGRGFLPGEDQVDTPLVAVLGYDLWRNHLAADPEVLGTTLRLNGEEAEVVGVMPPGFAFPNGQDLWLPLRYDPRKLARGEATLELVLGRLRDGVTLGNARAEMESISREVARLYPESNEGNTALLQPLTYRYVPKTMRLMLTAMLGCVLLVLLVACANVANLVLVRFTLRQREIAMRTALGAGRWRLLAPAVGECLICSLVATTVALSLAHTGAKLSFDLLRRSWPDQPFWSEISIDWRTVVFAAGAALLTTLLAGLVPALRTSTRTINPVLAGGSRGASRPLGRMVRALVVVELALSCVVLTCAGLMVRSVTELVHRDLGADTSNVLTGRIGLFESDYPEAEDRLRLYERLLERLAKLPDVREVALSTSLPGTFVQHRRFTIEGEENGAGQGSSLASSAMVSDGYFDLFKVPLVAGRLFNSGDRADSERVAVIGVGLAEQLGGAGAAVGQRLRLGEAESDGEWITIVGVVRTVVQTQEPDDTLPTIYLPISQDEARFVSIALRTGSDPLACAPLLQQTLMELDPDLPVYWLRTLEQWLEETRFLGRFLAAMFVIFAVTGLVLAAFGLYGVLAHTVVVRTRELGIRRALGASNRGIVTSLLRQGALQLVVGLGIGAVLSVVFAQLLTRFLYGVSAQDPLTFGIVSAVLAASAALASVLPARRALSVEPAEALRHE